MRIKLIGVLSIVVAFAVVAVALAVQTQQATTTFTRTKAGGPTGISTRFTVADTGNTKPGQEGKPTRQIKQVDINFPRGTTFNQQAVPKCTEYYDTFIVKKCKSAIVARGQVTVDVRGSTAFLPGAEYSARIYHGKLNVYNTPGDRPARDGTLHGLQLLVTSSESGYLNHMLLRGQLKGPHLLMEQPVRFLDADQAYITDFRLNFPLRYGRLGGRKVALAVLPGKCPRSGKFKVTTTFHFEAGGTVTTRATTNRCRT